MKTALLPLLLGAWLLCGAAGAQSITIGPDGISVTPAPGQTDVPNIRIDNNGVRVTVPARPGSVRVTPASRTMNCNNRAVNIRGEGGRFKLLGNCPLVSVTGSRNTVSVERLGQVNVRGSRNAVTYGAALRGSRIAQSLSGPGNTVKLAGRAAVAVRPAPARPAPVRPVPVRPTPIKPVPVKPAPAPAPPKTATPL